MRYSKFELFGKEYHSKLQCLDSMLVPTWRPQTSGNILSLLWLSQNKFLSLLNLKSFAWTLLLKYWFFRTRKHKKANRDFRARDVFLRSNPDLTHCKKIETCSNCSIFKTKHATELKTGQQIYLLNVFYPTKVKTEVT